MPELLEQQNTQEHDVDAIIAKAYSGSENPSITTEAPGSESQVTPPVSQAPQFKEYEFSHRGQAIKIKDNDPRFTQFLSQGHDYAQNVQTMKAEREKWEQSKSEWEKTWSPYKEVDAYAKENPDWWNHVDQSFKQKLSSQEGVPDPVKQYFDQKLEPIAKDIPLMKQFLQEMQTAKLEKQQADEDAKLAESVKSIQARYPDLDFKAKDETGVSLENRVLKHGIDNGFPTFRAAFLDYFHDSLEKQAEARGKEAIMKEINQRKKLGLLDDDQAPSKTINFSQGKPRSWNDPQLSSEAILKEMNFI